MDEEPRPGVHNIEVSFGQMFKCTGSPLGPGGEVLGVRGWNLEPCLGKGVLPVV